MNFPLILIPDPIKKTDISNYNYEASELMFDRFYDANVKNSSKTIITKPLHPSLNFKFFYKLENINILGILCLMLIWWIILPTLLVFILIDIFKYLRSYIIYSKDYKKYKLLLQSTNEYIDHQDFYFLVLSRFDIHLLNADFELEQTIREIKNNKLKEIAKNIVQPTDINQVKNLRKGISEAFFVDQLRSYFDFIEIKIVTDCYLDCYIPDIVLNTNTGISVDIEIDEPYVGDTKEIIHYYEPEPNYYCDEIRNNCFLESGWIVIRFSEKQIIKNSLSCCYEICLVLSKILDFDIPKDKVQKRLTPEKFWSRELGKEFVNSNYRNSYFPDKLNQRFANL